MDATNSKNQPCDLIAPKVIKPIETFLHSFHHAIATDGGNLTPKLLADFLTAADRLNNQCSQNVAWLLLEQSSRADVRASSEATIVRLVRNRCFDTLDVILENFAAYLAQLSMDLHQTVQGLTESRLRNALMGIESPSVENVKRFKLPVAARASAVIKMFDYFQHLQVTAKLLVQYGCQKLAVSNSDEETNRVAAVVQAALEEPFHQVLQLLENHEAVKRKLWEVERASENAILSSIVTASSWKLDRRKSTAGSLLLGILFAVPVWCTYASGTTNLYIGSATAISGIVALICFFRTVTVAAKYH